jgi:hypothetical protein
MHPRAWDIAEYDRWEIIANQPDNSFERQFGRNGCDHYCSDTVTRLKLFHTSQLGMGVPQLIISYRSSHVQSSRVQGITE